MNCDHGISPTGATRPPHRTQPGPGLGRTCTRDASLQCWTTWASSSRRSRWRPSPRCPSPPGIGGPAWEEMPAKLQVCPEAPWSSPAAPSVAGTHRCGYCLGRYTSAAEAAAIKLVNVPGLVKLAWSLALLFPKCGDEIITDLVGD